MPKIILPDTFRQSGFLPIDEVPSLVRLSIENYETQRQVRVYRRLASEFLEHVAFVFASGKDAAGATRILVALGQINDCIDHAYGVEPR